jgi:hypothetical protein
MSAIERIREIFNQSVADGLRADSVAGASDQQIDAMAASQGVDTVPAAVREVLRILGTGHGLWMSGSSLGVTVGQSAKDHARATLSSTDDPLENSGGMLVLLEHGAYTYHVVDGADQQNDDPPVWLITEGEPVVKQWSSVSEWFSAIKPNIAHYRDRLEIMLELGDDLPPWAQYIEANSS